MAATRTSAEREPLDREAIVAAAIAIADEEGIDALTMRNLARSLGYEVMSLYNHVANKDEVVAQMVDTIAAEIDDPPPGAEPLEAARALAVSARDALVRHPWVPQLWLHHVPGPARTRHMENLLRVLDDSGLAPDLAHHGFHAVNNHVLGYTLQEQEMQTGLDELGGVESGARDYMAQMPADEYPHTIKHVQQHLDGDTGSSFELVLDLILDGLVRLDEARPTA